MVMIVSHLLYLSISLVFTVWVARTLHKNGRIFIVDAFQGNEELADSINHLLLVGFYLINIGFVSLALKYGERPVNAVQSIEYLSTKIGLVLVILGIMHFFNLGILSRFRRKQMQNSSLPPVRPTPLKAKFVPESVA